MPRTPYHEFAAYGRSKPANVLCAVGLDARLSRRGVRATAVHPGVIQTELGRHLTPDLIQQMMSAARGASASSGSGSTPALGGRRFKSIPQGAATSVWAGIVAPGDSVGARYCEDCHVAEIKDGAGDATDGVRAYAVDPARAQALWRKSEEWVEERFAY